MPNDSVSVSFKCGKCETSLSWPGRVTDSTELFCTNCGESAGTYGDLRDAGVNAVKDKIESLFNGTLKHR